MLEPFSGSYAAQDVAFLLTRLELEPIDDVQEKERLIQSGEKHYSEIINLLTIRNEALQRNIRVN